MSTAVKTEDEKKLDALLEKTRKETEEKTRSEMQAEIKSQIDEALKKTVDSSTGKSLMYGGGVPAYVKNSSIGEVDKDLSAARYIKLHALSKLEGVPSNDPRELAKRMYPQDKNLLATFETKALGATNLTDGGVTVPQILASEIIMPLYTKIGVTKLGGRRVPLPNGNMTLPRIDTPASVSWVGENQAIANSQAVTGDTKLNAKKLAVLSVVSNDLLRSADIAADQWILDDIRNRMYVEMDRAMLYGSNTLYQPGGLATLLPPAQIQGNSTTAFPTTLITTLYGQLEQANVMMVSPGIVINGATEAYLMNLTTSTGAFLFYAEMVERGTIRGIPYAVSNNAAFTAGTPGFVDFFIGDWSEYIVGTQGDLMVETSREATYVSGGTTFSAFQNDQTIVRVISLQDYAIRHTASFIQYTAKLATS